jgi:outer membrane lipoprotein-sorting protein
MPHRPDRIALLNAGWPRPKQEMQPMPVMRTRSDTRLVRYHAFFSGSIVAFAVVFAHIAAAAVASAQAPASRDLFDRLFDKTLATRRSIHSIRARFTETTISSLLDRPIVAHGTVIAAPPARVLMTYTDPERRLVSIDGKTLVVAWPDRRERETLDIAQTQKRIDQYFTGASVGQLRSMFDITAEPDTSLSHTDRVDMRPKRKQIKAGLERLRLWIDRETLLLVQMEMTFPGGDKKTIRLEDVVVNVPISDADFRIP